MKLQKLSLKNIRSYTNHIIDFRGGITLFEGDIGSGKSSILNAIEFALFGLGDLSGGHLLRIGENEGTVELELDINGKPYTFGRSLKRTRNRVRQEDCYIVEGDTKTDYNVTDMKKRALQLLEFKEPTNPRSHSVIYRYAVFTPQEQMREVLGQRPEERKQTLRKAFGVEEYSTTLENTSLLLNDLNIDIRLFKSSKEEIGRIEERIKVEESGIKNLESSIEESKLKKQVMKQEIHKLGKIIDTRSAEVQKLHHLNRDIEVNSNEKQIHQKTLETLNQEKLVIEENLKQSLQAEENVLKLLPQYRRLIEIREKIRKLEKAKLVYDEKQHRIDLARTHINTEKTALETGLNEQNDSKEKLAYRITNIENSLKELDNLQNLAKDLRQETSILNEVRNENLEKSGEVQRLNQKKVSLMEIEKRKEKEWGQIGRIGVGAECPHCQQELTEEHYNLLEKKYLEEIKKLKQQLTELTQNQETLEMELERLKKKIQGITEKEVQLQKVNIKISELIVRKTSLKEIQEEHKIIEERIKDTIKRLEKQEYALKSKQIINGLTLDVNQLKPAVDEYISIRKELEYCEEMEVEKKYIENRAFSERIIEYKNKKDELEDRRMWLRETLIKLTKTIAGLEKESEKYKESEKEKNRLQEKLTETNKELASTETVIHQNLSRINEAKKRIKQHQEDLERHNLNIEAAEEHNLKKTWLQEAFIPSIKSIERNVLMTLNQEFNKLFKKWFKILIESEEIETYVDEEFTPIIDQAGYELDVESLSGGEKTSVALAYRLALNTIVKRVTNTMKSNLLILDEPTDGFSREQIYKMRDILNDLNCEQVIIVSHERELESVADHIYQVQKDGTVSTVSEPA